MFRVLALSSGGIRMGPRALCALDSHSTFSYKQNLFTSHPISPSFTKILALQGQGLCFCYLCLITNVRHTECTQKYMTVSKIIAMRLNLNIVSGSFIYLNYVLRDDSFTWFFEQYLLVIENNLLLQPKCPLFIVLFA